MNIVVVYIYPLNGAGAAYDNAFRYLHYYHANPAGLDHRNIVVCNGFSPTPETRELFGSLPNLELFEHDNSGYDIGGFQHVARTVKCDLMVFFGNSAYIRGPGWLARMADVFAKYGDIMYGSMQNAGHVAVGVWPHIRTTGFWMNPILLCRYPTLIAAPHQRYGFEHGPNSMTMWCQRNAGVLLITWHREYGPREWGHVPNGFHNGDQSEMITGDKNSMPPYYPVP